VPILLWILREHYAMHAAQLFIYQSSVPHVHVECASGMGHVRQKKYPLMGVQFLLQGIVFMFWHNVAYIELLYCVTNFELVWTWVKAAVVRNAKKRRLCPNFPYMLICRNAVVVHAYLSKCWRDTCSSVGMLKSFVIRKRLGPLF